MESLELKAVQGADVGIRMPLGDGGFVGTGAVCRLRLSDPSVQPMHARIRLAGDRYILTDVSEGVGVAVNDVQIKSRPLQAGDRIRLGSVVLEVSVAAQSPTSTEPAPESPAAGRSNPPSAGQAGRQAVGRSSAKGKPGSTGAPVAAQETTAVQAEQTQTKGPESGTPVWVVSGVIAGIAVAVVAGLWLHLVSLRGEVERRYQEILELAKSGRVTSAQALERYRGVLSEAEEVHPSMAERLKKMIRTMEAEALAAQDKARAALLDLDTKADELAGRGEYSKAADVYRNAAEPLRKAVEESRAPRIAELERLAAGQSAGQGKPDQP